MIESLPLAEELPAVFARMSGLLLSSETVSTALGLLTSLALEATPDATCAGVSVVDDARRTAAASDPLAERADAAQYDLDEGPCLAAAAARAVVRVDDVHTDGRWPRWAAAVRETGLRSSLSAPMVAGDRTLGAVKVYSTRVAAFGARDEHVLSLFAAQAAVLVANTQTYERAQRTSEAMRAALRARDVISRAQGVLMCREGVDEHTAMVLLTGLAQREAKSPAAVARALVDAAARRRR
jgi:GAF domain-containing protein